MNVTELVRALTHIQRTYPDAQVRAEGWNDVGDLMDIRIRGDVRLGRDDVGKLIVILR